MGIHLQNNNRRRASGTANTLGASRRIAFAAAGLIALTTPGLAADCNPHTSGSRSPAQCAGRDAIVTYNKNYAEPTPDVHVTVSFMKTDYGLWTEPCEKRPDECSSITTKTFVLSFSNTGKGPERDIRVTVDLQGAEPVDQRERPYMPAFDSVNIGNVISPYAHKRLKQYASTNPHDLTTPPLMIGFTDCNFVIPSLAAGQMATYKIRYRPQKGLPIMGNVTITSGTLVINQRVFCNSNKESCEVHDTGAATNSRWMSPTETFPLGSSIRVQSVTGAK
jgi:hypothetical protein